MQIQVSTITSQGTSSLFVFANLKVWLSLLKLQVGKGPYASEVSGIVKIGQTMTMVLGVKDDENKFDMMVSVNQYHHKITIISPIHDGEATLSPGAELCRSRWSARANPAGWWEGLCGELDHHRDNKTNDDGDDQSSLKFDKLDDKKARLKVKVAQKMN